MACAESNVERAISLFNTVDHVVVVARPICWPDFRKVTDTRDAADGATGARFVAALKNVIEHPEKLLLELK